MLDDGDTVQSHHAAVGAASAAGEFSAIENGGGGSGSVHGSTLGVPDPNRLSRQVSLRLRRKKLVRRVAARETWFEAADKIRVSHTRILVVLSVFEL